jgi:hypothetical protein
VTALFVIAALSAAACGYFFWQARSHKARKSQLLAVETMSTGELRTYVQAAADAAGPGAFAQHVELAGVARPGDLGILTSELSGTECVWHQHKVTRRYREHYRDSEGRRRTRTKEEVVTRHRTEDPFVLRDDSGEVVVVPTTNVQGGRKVVSRFEEGRDDDDRTEVKIGSFKLALPSSRGQDTIGYEYEEWVLVPDTRIFVQGEARDDGGRLEVHEPRDGRELLISTKSEAALLESADSGITQNTRFAIGAGVLAVVLAIAGVVVALVR